MPVQVQDAAPVPITQLSQGKEEGMKECSLWGKISCYKKGMRVHRLLLYQKLSSRSGGKLRDSLTETETDTKMNKQTRRGGCTR